MPAAKEVPSRVKSQKFSGNKAVSTRDTWFGGKVAFDCGLGVGSLEFNQVQIYTLSWNPQLLMLRMSIKLSAPPQHTTSNYQLAAFRNSSSTEKLQMSLRGKKNHLRRLDTCHGLPFSLLQIMGEGRIERISEK